MTLDVDRFVDRAALTRWLDANAPQIGQGPLAVEFLHGGTSNVILTIDRGGAAAVLRRAPEIPPPNSAKAMAREAKLLGALNGTDVPHPHLYGYCADETVIGTPFYVMERVDGWAPAVTGDGCDYPDPFDTPQARWEMGFAVIDALGALARTDPHAIGLSEFGKPDGFLARQVYRWQSQLHSYPELYPAYSLRDLPGIDEVAAWLRANLPDVSRVGIVHGDYGPPNILFAMERPICVKAIVDWELATLGDPLLDLALFLINLRDAAHPGVIPAAAYFDPTDFPTRQELIERYFTVTGRDLPDIGYYMVLAQFRMACILEYKVAASAGKPLEGSLAIFPDMVINLMRQAHAMILAE